MAKSTDQFSTVEHVLLGAIALLIPALVAESNGVLAFRAANGLDHNPHMPQFVDTAIVVPFTVVLIALHTVLIPRCERVARVVLSPGKRDVPYRVHRFAHSLFKLFYFGAMTIAGFAILHDEAWFPASLGGSGDVRTSFVSFDQAPSRAVQLYVLMQFAFQATSLITKLLAPYDNETLEVVVHDLVAMLLIGGSYLGNFIAIGTLIGFLNDACDFFEHIHFCIVDTDKKPLVATAYSLLMVAWGYLRLWVYPIECVYNAFLFAQVLDVPPAFYVPIISILVVLLVLQTFWFVLFARKAPRLLFAPLASMITKKTASMASTTTEWQPNLAPLEIVAIGGALMPVTKATTLDNVRSLVSVHAWLPRWSFYTSHGESNAPTRTA